MNIMRVRLAAHLPRRSMSVPTFISMKAGARLETASFSIPLIRYRHNSKVSICTTWDREIPIQETFWGEL